MRMLSIFSVIATAALCVGCGGQAASAGSSTSDTTAQVVDFNADSAYAYVQRQCDFGPRVPETPAHKACGEWLKARLGQWCDQVIAQAAPVTTFDGKHLNATNYIGVVNPDAPQRLLLLAHWDCRPWADNDPDASKRNEPVMGANDGASGVGVLLELARLMAEKKPNVGVDILLVDAEDWGTDNDEDSWALGTQYWVKNPHVAGYSPMYGILLDMVGAKGATFHKEGFSYHYAQGVVDAVWSIASDAGFAAFKPSQLGVVTDDHVPLNKAGIACIDIIDMRADSSHGFFKYWHTTADTMDHIDRGTLKAVGQTLANLIYEL